MRRCLLHFLLLLSVVCLPGSLFAQQASLAAGGHASGSGGVMSYSIGQPVYTSVSNPSGMISQGVQQAEMNVRLSIKVLLSGAYDAAQGLMRDSLRVLNLLPLTEPYSASPFNKPAIVEFGGETISPSLLSTNNQNAIVDWVFIELRSTANPATIVATRRALLQRDGDVVSHLDGVSPVVFSRMGSGNYYVAVKHRNHLGVMTSTPVFLGTGALSIDFTTMPVVYTINGLVNTPRRLEGGVYTLWPGDANNNKNVKYNGLFNDKDNILNALGGSGFLNSTLSGVYRMEDVNLDGKIRYNSTNNDRQVVLNAIGVSNPNTVYNQHTPN